MGEAAVEIAPDVYWLDGGGSNFYLCADEDGLTLIDTGMPKKDKLVWQALDQLGLRPSDLNRILITHADIDHTGSTAVIQQQTGAAVYTGAQSAALLPEGKSPEHLPWLINFLANLFFRYTAVPAHVIETVRDGDTLPILGGLQVIASPGHTLDHHSFFAPAVGVLFAGDALNTRDGRLQNTPPRITADSEAARQSAIRLLQCTPAVIACGHGRPLSGHSSEDVMQLFNQLRQEE